MALITGVGTAEVSRASWTAYFAGEPDVVLARLALWIGANALFHGTSEPEEQARQLRGEVREKPRLR